MAQNFLSRVRLVDGTQAAPALSFTGDTNTGIYWSTYSGDAKQLSIATDGATRASFNSAGITSHANVYTAAASSFRNYSGVWKATTGITGNGFEFTTADQTGAMTLSSTGSAVFTGTITAANNLTIQGGSAQIILKDTTDDDDHSILFRNNSNGDDFKITTKDFTSAATGDGLYIGSTSGDNVALVTNNVTALNIDTSQNATFAGNVTLQSTAPIFYLNNTTSSTGKTWRLSSAANGKMYITQDGVIDAITLDHTTGNATFAGTVTATHFYGDGSNLTNISSTDSTKVAKAGDTMTGNLTMDDSDVIFKHSDGSNYYRLGIDASANFEIYNTNYGRTDLLITQSTGNATFAGDVTVGPKSNATVQVSESGGATVKMLAGSVGRIGTYTDDELRIVTDGNDRLTISNTGDATFAGRILNSYSGTSSHTLQNSTSNGTILNLTSTGDSRTLTLQSDHIFSNGSFYLGNNSYQTNFRGSSYNFENGNATFAGTINIPEYIVHSGDTNSYFGFPTNDEYKVTINGSTKIFADASNTYLYFEGNQKLRTTNTGVTVTGTSAGNSLLINGGADAIAKVLGTTSGARLDLQTNSHHRFLQTIESDGRFRFYDQTNGAERFTITSAGNVGIAIASPASTLHVLGPNSASGGITLTSSTSDNTQKVGRIKTSHYDTSEEPFTAILTNAQASDNVLRLGGGSGAENAATDIRFYTAANNTTLTGTERLHINESGNAIFSGNVTLYSRLTFDYGGDHYFEAGTNTLAYKSSSGASIMLLNASTSAATFAGAVTSTGLTLTNQNPSLNFTDSSGSTYTAQWKFKDNDLQYLWGGGIKAYFTTMGIGIGDNGTTADARIERTGSSPYGLTFKTNNTSALSLDSSQNATFAGRVTIQDTDTESLKINGTNSNGNGSFVRYQTNGTNIGFFGAAYHLIGSAPSGYENDFGIRAESDLRFSIGATEKMSLSSSSFSVTPNATFAGTVDVGANKYTLTVNAPTNLTTTIVGETINVTFTASSTSNIDYYLVFSSVAGGDYGLISVIPPDDFSATMSVIDDSFDRPGTQAYRIYAVKNGVYSSALTGSRSYTISTTEPTNMSVIAMNNAYYAQWDPPSTNARFVANYNVYKHEHATASSLSFSSASLVYSGTRTSYMYAISGANNNNFHKFWVTITMAS